jgi:hypothetical protein
LAAQAGDIEKIVSYCDKQRIPIYIYGGGSTVTRSMEAVSGGVCLDMRIHLNKVVAFLVSFISDIVSNFHFSRLPKRKDDPFITFTIILCI